MYIGWIQFDWAVEVVLVGLPVATWSPPIAEILPVSASCKWFIKCLVWTLSSFQPLMHHPCSWFDLDTFSQWIKIRVWRLWRCKNLTKLIHNVMLTLWENWQKFNATRVVDVPKIKKTRFIYLVCDGKQFDTENWILQISLFASTRWAYIVNSFYIGTVEELMQLTVKCKISLFFNGFATIIEQSHQCLTITYTVYHCGWIMVDQLIELMTIKAQHQQNFRVLS